MPFERTFAWQPVAAESTIEIITAYKSQAMTELRVAWKFGLHENESGEPTGGGVWFPDTPENRRDVEIIVEEGNRACGQGTHWVEERVA